MKNTLKRLLSLLLVLSMVVSQATVAFATEVTGETEPAVQTVTEETSAAGDEESSAEPVQNSTDETVGSSEETVAAAEDADDVSEQATEASEEATEATEETSEATEETTEATEETTEATEETTEATEPTEETTEPTEEVAEEVITDEAMEAALIGTGTNMGAVSMTVISKTTNNVANGVSYDKVVVKNGSSQQVVGYLTQVDLSENVAIKAAYNGYYTEGSTAESRAKASADLGWSFGTTTGLAADYASIADADGTVVMATNGDYFNMGTGEPLGYLIMEGNAIKTKGEPYFAILKDGTAVIRDAGTDCSDVVEAFSGPFYLVKNSQIVASADDTAQMPRNSVGIKEDGSVVFFQADGRQAPYSVGMTLYEVASVLMDAGCVNALYLDGGGSATVAARAEGSDSLKVVNSPSDGQEREVSSAVLIVSTAEATGIFDHAAIAPNDELYTPNSKVQFTAAGVDTAGAPMDIPADVTWALADSSADMGSIDVDGLFTANDKTGEVTVEMRQNDKCVGSTTIQIVTPDSIYFMNEEISLGFEETTDFSVIVRYQERDINYKVGDIIWTITDEKMGTFDGNLFTSSDGESLNGEVTATSAYDETVSGTIKVIVGMLPTIVWDFEDVVNEDGTVTEAEDYYCGENGILVTSNYGRGGKESIEIVSIDDGEPVRFGEKSLKLNFDFTECGAVTEGATIGTPESMEIPGTPTAIGVWVYAPEGVGIEWEGDGTQAGFWLRAYVNNGTSPVDFTFEPKNEKVQSGEVQPGIYWEGWKYLEADLSKYPAPYSLFKNNTFRLMFVNATKMGTRTANAIYFDNFQFIYGTNVDDVDEPKVDSITVSNQELENGSELTTNKITLRTTFSDVQNKYTSGVDANTVRMYIDGVNVVDNKNYNFALSANDGYAELYDLELLDGQHSVTVSLRDNFGNDASETRYFTVNTGSAAPAVTVAPVEGAAILGDQVTLEVRASETGIASVENTIRLSNRFPAPVVTFAENYTGTYSYNKTSYTLTISAQRKDDAAETAEDDTLIATIAVEVPADLTVNDTFIYEIKSGSYTTADSKFYTYSIAEAKLAVDAEISVSCDPILVGGDDGVLKVTDRDGKPVANAGIYLVSGDTLIGTTDENGELETDYFNTKADKVAIYATNEDGMPSFQYNVFSYEGSVDAAAAPDKILFNSVSDSTTQKSLSWISNPLAEGTQSIRYRVEGTEEWTVKEAKTTMLTFATDGNKAANANSVILTGLTPGTTYEYQVGTGELWSESATLATDAAYSASTKFFVISDIQAKDLTNVETLMGIINNGGYDFGIQTGDAIDNVTKYSEVEDAIDLLGKDLLNDTDMIRVLGNHEYYGDANAEVTSALYSLPNSSAGTGYSVTYGDVYVATIHFTDTEAQLKAALEWLVKDAQASNATWKILAMHQPPYYTNDIGGNAPINALVPTACEEAGIDAVFSGHDHSLARTNQLTNGEVDEENGILYYIGGSSGEKSYSITSQSAFDFDTIFGYQPSVDFNATYISVEANELSMTLKMYDVLADGTEVLEDTYTLYTATGSCDKAGHELDAAVYDRATGMVICNNCGMAVDAVEVNYTDWATDKETGRKMYLIQGVPQTGEFLLEEDVFYFDENGVAYDGKITVDEVELEFDNGLLIGGYTGFVKKISGNTYHYENGQMTYGWYEEDGYWYHFNTDTGVMNTGTHVKPDAEAMSKNAYYDFGEDGKLLRGYFNPAGYYYWAGLPLTDAWVKNGADSDPDAWYRTNGSGHFVTDGNMENGKPVAGETVIAIDGIEYTFDNTNGKLLKGTIVNKNGVLSYYWAGEPANNGWFELDGNTYYAQENGRLATGSKTIGDETYMFDQNGVLVTEGIILTAALNEGVMKVKIVNVEDATKVRLAVWGVNTDQNETMQWFDCIQSSESIWTVEIPMCRFNLADTYALHAYDVKDDGQTALISTTIEVPVAVDHTYTDDRDGTCNICNEQTRIVSVPMYRMYNPNSGEHFYTGSTEERDGLVELGWQYEGVAWNAPVTGEPVYRVYNPNSGDHHYTVDQAEVDMLKEAGWQYEGVAWNTASEDDVPQYRLWNPNADLGSHHYTSSTEERDALVELGWVLEGIGWYGLLK